MSPTCSSARRYFCMSSRSFAASDTTACPCPLTSASAIRETMQLGQTDTKWTSPPASPVWAGTECTHAAKPGSSTRLAVLWFPAHVSAHSRRLGMDYIRFMLSPRCAVSRGGEPSWSIASAHRIRPTMVGAIAVPLCSSSADLPCLQPFCWPDRSRSHGHVATSSHAYCRDCTERPDTRLTAASRSNPAGPLAICQSIAAFVGSDSARAPTRLGTGCGAGRWPSRCW